MGLGDVYRYQAEATPPINGKTDLRKAMESYRKASERDRTRSEGRLERSDI